MRKILTLLCSAGLVMLSGIGLSTSLNATSVSDGDPEIIVLQPSTNIPGGPRTPDYNPFTAYLQNNQVVLESSENCGLVAVEITSTTGFYSSTVFDTEDGSVIIPIDGQAGNYNVCLTTPSGLFYFGMFVL